MYRAEHLDKQLKYRQYLDRPNKTPRTTQVIRWFIGLVGAFWLIALLSPYAAQR
jgi:hypothetical protein